jgi:hypothetical protein
MMKRKTTPRNWIAAIAIVLVLALLAGCSSTHLSAGPELAASDEPQASAYLDTSYADALDVSGQLALGSLLLEETENAVTAEQAAALLPLWQAVRSGTLQSEAETDAVWKQIEGAMTSEQLAAIQAMQLTADDLTSWAQSQGVNLEPRQGFPMPGEDGGLPPEVEDRLREQFGGELPSPEQLEELRGQFGNMSEEEREARRATAEASGGAVGARGAGLGQWAMLLDPLIELLTGRAAA